MAAIKRKWLDAFGSVSAQGNAPTFSTPVSPSGQYIAFLAKVEELEEAGTSVLVMFDMMTFEWTTNAASTAQTVKAPAPLAPPTQFTIASVALTTLQSALGVSKPQYVAEGSWYYLTLSEGGTGPLSGDLIDGFFPDDDGTKDYGTYTLGGGQLLLLPQQRSDFTTTVVPPPPGAFALINLVTIPGAVINLLGRIGAWFGNVLGMAAPPPPPQPQPVAPSIVAIGVMDVGAGGCNILFKQSAGGANTLEPFLYLDVGRPIPRWGKTSPPNFKPQAGVASGPIQQNSTATLGIVLTHWDYDHWGITKMRTGPGGPRLLTTLPLTFPQQQYGPTAAAIAADFPASNRFPANLPSLVTPDYSIYVVTVVTDNEAEDMNNTGLAMLVPFQFPIGAPASHHCLLPGDASIGNIHPTMPRTDVTVYGAVHHGATSFGAAQNLPIPPVVPGSVVFSYGITSNTNEHAYGHPFQGAITANTNAQFTTMFATAETVVQAGTNIGANGVRGNALIGTQWPLATLPIYQNTIFFTFNKAVT